MGVSRTEFKARVSRLPKRRVEEVYVPEDEIILTTRGTASILSPLGFIFSAFLGFGVYFLMPFLLRSFGSRNGEPAVVLSEWTTSPLWLVPSLITSFGVTIGMLSLVGLGNGGHLRSAAFGVGLAFVVARALTG